MRTTLRDGKYYVIDLVTGEVCDEEFASAEEARKHASECNTADDLAVGIAYRATGRDGAPCMKLRPATSPTDES